jgi:hypothetical protein
MQHPTDIALHRAAQYLASFGKQYIQPAKDDSHTNLGWDSKLSALYSRGGSDGQFMRLYLADLRLEWVDGERSFPLGLEGRSHGEITVWLHHIALRCGKEEYDFYLHYTLDSGKIKPDYVFDDYDSSRAEELISLRNKANETSEAIRKHFDFDTEIRIWPHHFDTGGYAALPGSDTYIGFGMAIPDSIVDGHYLYASAYRSEAVGTEGLADLDQGSWQQGDFEGAVLPMYGTSPESQIEFLKNAIMILGA